VLGSNDKSTAAYNCSGRPTQLERISANTQVHLTQANGIFWPAESKKASDIAVLDPAASSY
jgi:hypothetical protein